MPGRLMIKTTLLKTLMPDTALRHCAAAKSYVNFAA
jgi:hypothetical protein